MYWLIPCTNNMYNILEAFDSLKAVYWTESVNYDIGDIVYIYCDKPYERVMFKCEVIEAKLSFKDIVDQIEFWVREDDFIDSQNKTFVSLKLVKKLESDELSLDNLLLNGLSRPLQAPILVKDELLLFITSAFNKADTINEIDDKFVQVQQIKDSISKFVESKKWAQFYNPKNLAMSISIEATELMEIYQWCTPEECWDISESKERENIEEQLSDIMIYCLSLADQLDIDVSSAIYNKIKKNKIKYK